ncbi:MAG: hypothetical protein ACPHN2_19240 [Sinimarinibacterium flocculans]|uniref:Multidrug transporter n=1 Tax=Sinimarinibacterium flocculans TaxID=985250 RepID=A0A318EI33_9GAMM|nr:hypothetical protein [Sinimarinibacterium flocculans]MEC9362270.1 hypothetical protein [Pseudomonadota bacterium]PXV70449.1 hypothetical protein C8D93_102308 [Sinimarinibacterium flocculans]
MNSLKHFAAAAVLALAASVGHAQMDSVDESPSAAAMAFDFVVVRPLGLVATVGGIALFIAQLPFALIQGEPPSEPAQRFVVEPAAYTFTRPLGELE